MHPIPRMDLSLNGEILLAYGMQLFVCIAMASIIGSYCCRDRQPHLRCWTFSWVSLALYVASAMLSITLIAKWHLPAGDARRLLISTISMMAGYFQPMFLYVGVHESVQSRSIRPTTRRNILLGVTLFAIVLTVATVPLKSPSFVRLGVRDVVAGVLFLLAAGQLFQHTSRTGLRGPALLGVAALAYGLGQFHGLFWLMRREMLKQVDVFAFYLGHADVLLQFFLGLGMLMWHLESQRERTRMALRDLEQSQAGLRQAQKMELVGRLAGGVAHDFNNLMTVMYAATEDLDPSVSPGPRAHESVQELRYALERAKGLTSQLLSFSRKQVEHREIMDLGAFVTLQERLLSRLVGSEVRIQLAVSEQAVPILADPDQLSLVTMNLVVNARDAMKHGGEVRIEVATETVDKARAARLHLEPGPYAVFRVVDHGKGMPDHVRERIFEPFFTTKVVGEGTGLGLSTAYGIVRAAAGAIEVDSVLDRGTTFTVLWPLQDAGTSTGIRPVLELAHPSSLTGRVLFVEDDAHIRAMLTRQLEQCGLAVVTAVDGEHALATFRGDPAFDLVITDVIMPGMDGGQLIRALRELAPEIRILTISGYSGDLSARELPADVTWLQKPFSSAEFHAAVMDALPQSESAMA